MVEALIFIAALFAGGGVLVLERHCLGQMAIVQPLVVCLLAGWITGNEAVALWLGVSLQLFSLTAIRHVDWALTGTVAAAALLVAARLGVDPAPGALDTSALALVAVLVGMGSRLIEREIFRVDGKRLVRNSPLQASDPAQAVESYVHRGVMRWLFVGGAEVVAGTVAASMVLVGLGRMGWHFNGSSGSVAVAIPSLGAAVAVGSLAKYRFIVWTAGAALAAWAVLS